MIDSREQVCANNNQYYEGEDAGMMSEAETSSSRTRRGGLPGREVVHCHMIIGALILNNMQIVKCKKIRAVQRYMILVTIDCHIIYCHIITAMIFESFLYLRPQWAVPRWAVVDTWCTLSLRGRTFEK